MSGPKSFRTRVTNAHLQQIFQLQSEISLKCDELSRLALNDSKRNIFADCAQFLQSCQRLKTDLLKPVSVEYVDELPQKLHPLQEFISQIDAEHQTFHNKQEDYRAFLTYETYYAASAQAVQTYKTQVLEYLQTYLQQAHSDILQHAATQITPVQIPLKPEPFSWNFRDTVAQKKQAAANAIEQAKGTVNGVRISVSNQVLALSKSNIPAPAEPLRHADKDIQAQIRKINDYIADAPDAGVAATRADDGTDSADRGSSATMGG